MIEALLLRVADLRPALEILFKITVALGAAWAVHFALKRANPRWRVLPWREMAVFLALAPALVWLVPRMEIPIAAAKRSPMEAVALRTVAVAEALKPFLREELSRKSTVEDMQEMMELGFKPGAIASITIRGDQAFIATDFMPLEEHGKESMRCIIYHVRRESGDWLVWDIDLENTQTLIEEVQRFENKTGPKN